MPGFGLEGYLAVCLYAAAIAAFLRSAFWRPIVGLYFLVPSLPLQTIRYRLNDLPLGQSLVYLMLLGVGLGLLRLHQPILRENPWTRMLVLYCGLIFVSLCLGSFFLNAPLPMWADDRRLSDWSAYMTMPALLFLVTAAAIDLRQIKVLVGPPITGRNDPRVTRLGRLLRRTKLDELPQFVNVLLGDMTLVGPRPEAPEIVARYTPSQRAVLDAKPGVTGCVQLEAIAKDIPECTRADEYHVRHLMERKLRRDLEYLRTRTPASDARIVLATTRVLLRSLLSR